MSEARKSDLIDIACEVRRTTDHGIAIADGQMEVHNGREREKWTWVPLAHVEVNSDGTITMPEWLAQKAGLI